MNDATQTFPTATSTDKGRQSFAVARAILWAQKWRWYERNSLPWNRARIHWELMRREAFVRWPVHGNVLEALREGRLEIGANAVLEPNVWITAPGEARIRIGAGSFLNIGVMVAAAALPARFCRRRAREGRLAQTCSSAVRTGRASPGGLAGWGCAGG